MWDGGGGIQMRESMPMASQEAYVRGARDEIAPDCTSCAGTDAAVALLLSQAARRRMRPCGTPSRGVDAMQPPTADLRIVSARRGDAAGRKGDPGRRAGVRDATSSVTPESGDAGKVQRRIIRTREFRRLGQS
ncbi:hypothetical protein C8R44DRAFT_226699 [Mycena epipterygia]|nr:hypothetical protein C8R44DRAFT_226699 [Mycena epipterygia]